MCGAIILLLEGDGGGLGGMKFEWEAVSGDTKAEILMRNQLEKPYI